MPRPPPERVEFSLFHSCARRFPERPNAGNSLDEHGERWSAGVAGLAQANGPSLATWSWRRIAAA